MSSYLTIAEEVLETARRPLSAKAILRAAYFSGKAPSHLYGATQHKTLQARLSEDILQRRELSAFFRTKPGQFFLRKFISDLTIPAEYRVPMIARRRTRELFGHSVLAMRADFVGQIEASYKHWSSVCEAIKPDTVEYVDPKRCPANLILIWSIASVIRGTKVLAYRLGRYRENRDSFVFRRSIYFSTLVNEQARSLFDFGGYGIASAGAEAAMIDLDIPPELCNPEAGYFQHSLRAFIPENYDSGRRSLLAFVEIAAPEWFEPTTKRLSMNDLHWIDFSVPPNDLSDFDPWSQRLLSHLRSEVSP